MSFIKSVRQQADRATLEADKLIRIRREQAAVSQLQRDIRVQLDALATATLAAHRAGNLEQPALTTICLKIEAMEAQIRQHEGRVEAIRAEQLAPGLPLTDPQLLMLPCPTCKQLIPEVAAFCPHCGNRVIRPVATTTVCQACGAQMKAGAAFCAACGHAVTASSKRCSGCGAPLPEHAAFCAECGTRVVKETVGQSSTFSVPASPDLDIDTQAPPEASPASEAPESGQPGQTVEAKPAITKPCPTCHLELPLEAVFCPDCGTRV